MATIRIVTINGRTDERQTVASSVRLITDALYMAEALSKIIRVGTDVVVETRSEDYYYPGQAVFGNID